jgi:hypothetical protein
MTAPRLRAGDRAAFRRTTDVVTRQLKRDTGPRSRAMTRAARVLRDAIRTVISTPGTPSNPAPPGAPPHRITRELLRSWGTGVVNGVRRVGSGWFVARLQEDGTESMAPHPYARQGLANAERTMVDTFVGELLVGQAASRGFDHGLLESGDA